MESWSVHCTVQSEQDEDIHHQPQEDKNDQVFTGMIYVFAEACVL